MATTALPVAPPGQGMLRVATPAAVTAFLENQHKPVEPDTGPPMTALAGHVRSQWEMMKRHRDSGQGWSERLLHAQRVFNGSYDAQKLAEIKEFGGSEIYARLIALKCRGATALLREVFVGGERPWGLDPTPEPVMPEDLAQSVSILIQMELATLTQTGQPIDINAVRDRTNTLMAAGRRAAIKRARKEAKAAEDKLDDYLVEGGLYEALAEFLVDVPLFPFACLKGPVVRIVPDVVWRNGKAVTESKAKMFWERKSPFDIFWTPGVSNIRDADIIERVRLTRADLNDLLGLPGYNEENIRAVLDEYGRGGLRDWIDTTDSERAAAESRENPSTNASGMIDCIEYHGNVQGRMLLEYGLDEEEIEDELRDYFVQVWLIGRYVIKAQISPNPRKRHPYYITSYEKVPGTPLGNALPDILADVGDAANAAMRAMVNNQSIASGPQVVIDESRLSPHENPEKMHPWKVWRTVTDPMAGNQSGSRPPVEFFSPASHTAELFGIYKELQTIADELSGIPRYVTGSGAPGGAGRTASGLAMLMGNASKLLQMVAANIDRDVMLPLLTSLYDMVMMVDDSGLFRGDEAIRVRGVEVVAQKETTRQRSVELLGATANPLDAQIIGLPGRAKLLRAVLEQVVPGEDIVPSEDEMMANAAQGAPGQPGAPNPALPPPEPGTGTVSTPGGPPAPGGSMPAPPSQVLGVEEAASTRGVASFEKGGLVEPSRGKRVIRVIRDSSGRISGFIPE